MEVVEVTTDCEERINLGGFSEKLFKSSAFVIGGGDLLLLTLNLQDILAGALASFQLQRDHASESREQDKEIATATAINGDY